MAVKRAPDFEMVEAPFSDGFITRENRRTQFRFFSQNHDASVLSQRLPPHGAVVRQRPP